MSTPDLPQALETAARSKRILVATDYDGTLAEIVDDPLAATVPAHVIESLSELGERSGVSCHVISGRSLGDLRVRLAGVRNVSLWGSYGAETENAAINPDKEDQVHLAQASTQLLQILPRFPGAWIEHKPLSIAFHTRQLSLADAEAAEDAARDAMAASPLHGALGKRVIEWCVLVPDKSAVVRRLRASERSEAVIYLGDDHSDEWIFRKSEPGDVMIKVGEGASAAQYRLETVDQARAVLRTLLALRSSLGLPEIEPGM